MEPRVSAFDAHVMNYSHPEYWCSCGMWYTNDPVNGHAMWIKHFDAEWTEQKEARWIGSRSTGITDAGTRTS